MNAASMQMIRVYLQKLDTKEFYKAPEEWTANIKQAHDFGLVPEAICFGRKLQLSNAQVVLSLDGYGPVTLPIK